MAGNWIAFDPTQSNLLYAYTGIGVSSTHPPTSNVAFTWNSDQVIGIENLSLVQGWGLTGGGIYFTAQDLLAWLPPNVTTGQYPNTFYGNNGNTLVDVINTSCTDGSTTFIAMSGLGLTYSVNGGAWSAFIAPPSGNQYGSCIVRSTTNWIWLNGGNLYYTTNSGSSFSNCTFGNAIGGRAVTYNGGGWISMAVDASGNVMIYNDGSGSTNGAAAGGFWKASSGCAFTQVDNTMGRALGGASNAAIIAVPNQSCGGSTPAFWGTYIPYIHSPSLPLGYYLSYTKSCSGGWTQFSTNLKSILAMAWGAPLAGSDGYPTFYCACWYNDGVHGYVYGIWQIENIDSGSPIYTNIDVSEGGYPTGNFDAFSMVGDLATPGTVYVLFSGSGGAYRTAQ